MSCAICLRAYVAGATRVRVRAFIAKETMTFATDVSEGNWALMEMTRRKKLTAMEGMKGIMVLTLNKKLNVPAVIM
jgi:hypothetical protein